MKNVTERLPIFPLGHINVDAAEKALQEHAGLFGQDRCRETAPGSAHADTETIFLRWPNRATPHVIFETFNSAYQPAMDIEAFAEGVFNIERMLHALVIRAIIVKLPPGGVIREHTDTGAYAEGTSRFHLPIIAPVGSSPPIPGAVMRCGGYETVMLRGVLYFFNKHLPHSAWNPTLNDRVHLIVDILDDFPPGTLTRYPH